MNKLNEAMMEKVIREAEGIFCDVLQEHANQDFRIFDNIESATAFEYATSGEWIPTSDQIKDSMYEAIASGAPTLSIKARTQVVRYWYETRYKSQQT